MRLIDADALMKCIPREEYCSRFAVANAPTVEPQQTCEYWDSESKFCALCRPSAQPQRWIPCNEKLPDNDDFVIVTILDEHGDTPYRYSDFGWYFDRAKCWIIDAEERTDVIAWMPLPTPYIVE